jgi:hypothetical protein
MLGHHLAAVDTARRAILALVLATPLVLTPLGPIAPAHAAERDPRDPLERLQVVIRKVYIRDDNDWFGEGEFDLTASVNRCAREKTTEECRKGAWEKQVAYHHGSYDADSGDDKVLDQLLPAQGFAVAPGERYAFHLKMLELDYARPIDDSITPDPDHVGEVTWMFGEDDGWRLGTHKVRAFSEERYAVGDFDVEFEVRRVPLPDLTARTIRSVDDGAQQFRCVVIENVGLEPSDDFQLTIRADETRLRTVPLQGLAVGESVEHCALLSELPPGQQSQLSFVIDDDRQLAEMNEMNNRIDLPVARIRAGDTIPQIGFGPGSASATAGGDSGPTAPPTPTPHAALPDLRASAIRVNGQVPDGNDDCKEGKNDVTVVVTNIGTANAAGFVVRLEVLGAQHPGLEQSVSDLGAGQERVVRFDGVRLKKGDQTLLATADAREAVAESNDQNNGFKVLARCKDAD